MSETRDGDPAPLPPVRPTADDCCQGGCARCVYDLYEDAMDRYRADLAAWRARHGEPATPG
jgi:hypothetical protein